MSNLKRTRQNFPKMKVRGKARRKRRELARLEEIVAYRTARFDKAMAILGGMFGEKGMKLVVTDHARAKLEEANRYE